MKKLRPKVYVYGAAVLVAVIAILLYYFFFSTFSKKTETVYVYIDEDDTPDRIQHVVKTLGV